MTGSQQFESTANYARRVVSYISRIHGPKHL